MHILFLHQNFPAQFGHIANYLVKNKGFRGTFVSEQPAALSGGIERIQYRLRGGATEQTHYSSRSFEADKVLDKPEAYKPLGLAGVKMIQDRYSLHVCLPQMLALYEDAFRARREPKTV